MVGAILLLASLALAGGAPARAGCHVPRLLGEGPWWAKEQLAGAGCNAFIVGGKRSHLGRLVVFAQSAPPGSALEQWATVDLRLGPRPNVPRDCRPPRLTRVLARTSDLAAWVNPCANPTANGAMAKHR
jgi:hypothetical protein